MKYQIPDCIGSRLRRLSRITDTYFRKCLTDFDITENQMTILFALSKLGKVEQGKIGEKLILERSTVSRNVGLLTKKNLVARTENYRPKIELTKKGLELVKVLLPEWEKVMDHLMEKLGHEGYESIENLERKLM